MSLGHKKIVPRIYVIKFEWKLKEKYMQRIYEKSKITGRIRDRVWEQQAEGGSRGQFWTQWTLE